MDDLYSLVKSDGAVFSLQFKCLSRLEYAKACRKLMSANNIKIGKLAVMINKPIVWLEELFKEFPE